jgi:hypothetical protein
MALPRSCRNTGVERGFDVRTAIFDRDHGRAMSSVQRFLSASAASWVKILFTVFTQVLLVPVILSHWTVEQFGCWLIIQTVQTLATLVSSGHQIYVGFEFLQVGDKQREDMRRLFYSALPWVFVIAALELLVLSGLVYWGFMDAVFDAKTMDPGLLRQARWSVVLFSAYAFVSATFGGLAGRAVAPYGDFPRMTWWGTLLAIVTALAQGIAVILGANLIQTVMWVIISGLVTNVPIHLDLIRMFRNYGLKPARPDLRMGGKNVYHSIAIAIGAVLDNVRQQGVRIFLGALVGVAEMTAFSTRIPSCPRSCDFCGIEIRIVRTRPSVLSGSSR